MLSLCGCHTVASTSHHMESAHADHGFSVTIPNAVAMLCCAVHAMCGGVVLAVFLEIQ